MHHLPYGLLQNKKKGESSASQLLNYVMKKQYDEYFFDKKLNGYSYQANMDSKSINEYIKQNAPYPQNLLSYGLGFANTASGIDCVLFVIAHRTPEVIMAVHPDELNIKISINQLYTDDAIEIMIRQFEKTDAYKDALNLAVKIETKCNIAISDYCQILYDTCGIPIDRARNLCSLYGFDTMPYEKIKNEVKKLVKTAVTNQYNNITLLHSISPTTKKYMK